MSALSEIFSSGPKQPTASASTTPLSKIFNAPAPSLPTVGPLPAQTPNEPTQQKPSTLSSIFAPKPTSTPSPYFYAKTDQGGTLGYSQNEQDTSGRPFLAYRKPGDTATTTDYTRVAGNFDPRLPQPLTRDQYYNPRSVAAREELKRALGAGYSDELDHAIALTLSGSNNPANLRVIPGTENQAYGSTEARLAQEVASGKKSLFDAQVEAARLKGVTKPYTPDQEQTWLEKAWDSVRNFVKPTVKSSVEPKTPPETPESGPNVTLPSEEQLKAPRIDFGPAPTATAVSTPAMSTDTAYRDVANYLFNPKGTVTIQPLGFKPEEAITITGPRIFSGTAKLIVDAVSGTVKDLTRGAIDVYGSLVKRQDVKVPEVLRPFAERFDLPMNAEGIIKTVGERTIKKQSEYDAQSPNTPNLNSAKAFTDEVLPTIFGLFFVGDAASSANRAILSATKSSPIFGLSAQTLRDLAPEEAANLVLKRFADEMKTVDLTTASGRQQASRLISEVKRLGVAFKDQTIPELNQFGQTIDNLANRLETDVTKLNRPLYESPATKPSGPEASLPGYVPMYETPIPAGLSTQPVKPVGFATPTTETGPSTKILEQLKAWSAETGKSEAPTQMIRDWTNAPDLKQTERDIVRAALSGATTVNVNDFVDKVKAELLPLEAYQSGNVTAHGTNVDAQYEHVTLPPEVRGKIANYDEMVYESPIKTSAGGVHFNQKEKPNYFGHTRVEDMADNSTRRVIEVQSDLYQKGRLEGEVPPEKVFNNGLTVNYKGEPYKVMGTANGRTFATLVSEKTGKAVHDVHIDDVDLTPSNKIIAKRKSEVSKLQQYNNPTAHFRMVREEVARAAKDNKTKLQFPTGETAMKIEGLGRTSTWRNEDGYVVKPDELKVGNTITQGEGDFEGGQEWIVTDVLGDGKFKAVPRNSLESELSVLGVKNENLSDSIIYLEHHRQDLLDKYSETFDISGKVDTNNPIYRFYEKDLGRFLKNNYEAQLVTDNKGVTWWEVKVKPEYGKRPVLAFKTTKKAGYNQPIEKVREAIYSIIPKNKVQLIFTKDPIEGFADGYYQQTVNPAVMPIIKIFESRGKASMFTGLHETGHFIFDPRNGFMTKAERDEIFAIAKKNMTMLQKLGKVVNGYKGEQIIEEYVVDEWAKQKAAEKGFHGPWKRALEIFDRIAKKIYDAFTKIKNKLDEMLPKKGRQGGYVGFGKEQEKIKLMPEEKIEPRRAYNKSYEEQFNKYVENPVEPTAENIKKLAAEAKISESDAINILTETSRGKGAQKPIIETFERKGDKHAFRVPKNSPIEDKYKNEGQIINEMKRGLVGNKYERIHVAVFPKEFADLGYRTDLHLTYNVIEKTADLHGSFPVSEFVNMTNDPEGIITFPMDEKGVEKINILKKFGDEMLLVGAVRVNGYNLTTFFDGAGTPEKIQEYLQTLKDKGGKLVYQSGGARSRYLDIFKGDTQEVMSNPQMAPKDQTDKGIVSQATPEVKAGVDKLIGDQMIDAVITEIAKSKDAVQIEALLKKNFALEPREVMSLAQRLKNVEGNKSVRRLIEGDERLRRTIRNDAIINSMPMHMQERIMAHEIQKETLAQMPAKKLSRFTAKAGDYKGRLPEQPSNLASIKMTELGFQEWESAREAYDKYALARARFKAEDSSIRGMVRAFVKEQNLNNIQIELNEISSRLKLQEAELSAAQRLADEALRREEIKRKIADAVKKATNPVGLFRQLAKEINPVKHLDPTTKKIVKTWKAKSILAKALAQEEFDKFEKPAFNDMQSIHEYQAGAKSPFYDKIHQIFDSFYIESINRGIITNYWSNNYLPQLWAGKSDAVFEAARKYYKAIGMTDEEIDRYFAGDKLPGEITKRLKINPFFTKSRIFPDYKTGMEYGLVPKFRNIPSLVANYRLQLEEAVANRELLDSLLSEGKLSIEGLAPKTWKPVDTPFSPRGYYADPDLADFLNKTFRDEEHLNFAQRTAKALATLNSKWQYIRLSGGFPYTSINFFTFGQAYKAVETALGALATLSPREAADQARVAFASLRANSNSASANFFQKNRKYITMLASEGVDIGNYVGNFYKTYENIMDSNWLKKALRLTNKYALYKAFEEKTFASMLPQQYVSLFKSIYERSIKDGVPTDEAKAFAAETVKKSFGISDYTGRGKTFSDVITSIFFAPRYRESLINIYLAGGKGWSSAFKDKTFSYARKFIIGSLIMYALYDYANRQLNNGDNLWDNPSGHKFDLKIPTKNGTVIYIPYGPSIFALVRNAIGGAWALGEGDISTAKQQIGSAFSMPIKTASEISANQDYFGRPIYNDYDSTAVKARKIAVYLGLAVNHPFIQEMINWIDDKKPIYQAALAAMEFPVKFGDMSKESKSEFYNAIDEKNKARYQELNAFRPTFDAIQKLVQEGKQDEAKAMLDKLSDPEYQMYKTLKTTAKRVNTIRNQSTSYQTYQDIQKLLSNGKRDEAQAIVNKMTDSEYKSYQQLKKKFQGK